MKYEKAERTTMCIKHGRVSACLKRISPLQPSLSADNDALRNLPRFIHQPLPAIKMTRYRTIIAFIGISIFLSGCSALIYAIRGPKYEGKFKEENYLEILRDQYYYAYYDRSEDFNDSIRVRGTDTIRITRNYSKYTYVFVRYDNDGLIRYKSISADFPLKKIPSKEEVDSLPIRYERYYVIKDSLIKYEVYHDSYNGYNLYKTRIFEDSLVDWQVGISKMYLTTYNKIIN